MFYHGSDKKRHKDQVRKVAFTQQFLGERTNFSFTAYAISEIVAQTDVRIKKRVRTRVFFWFWGHRRLWPQNQKKHGSVPIPQNMVRIVCEVRTPFLTRPYLIFLPRKRPFRAPYTGPLRWLKTVSSTFQDTEFDGS